LDQVDCEGLKEWLEPAGPKHVLKYLARKEEKYDYFPEKKFVGGG